MMGVNRSWTDDDDAALRRLIGEGKTASAAAAVLGRSRNSCLGRAHRLGIGFSLANKTKGHRASDPPRASAAPVTRPARAITRHPPKPVSVPRPVMVPLPPPEAPVVAAAPVRLIDLQPRHCRYALGGFREPAQFFCGAPRIADSSYCAGHHARCCVTPAVAARRQAAGQNAAQTRAARGEIRRWA